MNCQFRLILLSATVICFMGGTASYTWSAPPYQTKWGTSGIGDGELLGPHGVATAPNGNVYVCEFDGHRIQKFDPAGNFLTKWGEYGNGEGQFNHAAGVAVDSDGYVYVSSYYGHNIQKFTSDGTFVTRWGTNGTGDGEFRHPFGITVDANGDILVADSVNGRVQKFTNTGTFLMAFGAMTEVHGVAVDADGYIYATDPVSDLVNKFASDGSLELSWGIFGTGDGELWWPSGVVVDENGTVYVSELGNDRVQMFTTGGVYVDKWGTPGTGDGEFDHPQGLALHANGPIYVSDTRNDRIQVFGIFPVPVTLDYFTVERGQEGAVLRWQVNDHLSHDLSFDVYRQVEGGQLVRVTQSAISSQGDYEYVDRDAPATRTDYWVEEIDTDGTRYMHGPRSVAAASENSLAVGPNHPNPFNPSTTIQFTVPDAGQTRLDIFDAQGRLVKILVDEPMDAGSHEKLWDGRNEAGEMVRTGVYFARLEQRNRQRTHKLLLLK